MKSARFAIWAIVFVAIWGLAYPFIGTGVAAAGPVLLLVLRAVVAVTVTAGIAVVRSARWPATRGEWRGALSSGLSFQFAYVLLVHVSVAAGSPPSLTALVLCLQPATTTLMLRGVPVHRTVLVVLTVAASSVAVLANQKPSGTSPEGLFLALAAVMVLTLHVRTAERSVTELAWPVEAAIQNGAALIAAAPLIVLGDGLSTASWSIELAVSVAYLAIAISVAAPLLLARLVRARDAVSVASLICLAPGVAVCVSLVTAPAISRVTLPALTIAVIAAAANVWAARPRGGPGVEGESPEPPYA